MLDEKQELLEYTSTDIDENSCRLNAKFFFEKNRGGVPRALTIIARHYLFDVYDYASLTDAKDKHIAREKVKHILAAWCGFELHTNTDEYPDTEDFIDTEQIDKIQDWLPNYLLNSSYSSDKKEYIEVKLYGKDNTDESSFTCEWSKKWYVRDQKDIYQLVNHKFSVNSINFYTIIADAICQGVLKHRTISYNGDFSERCKKINWVIRKQTDDGTECTKVSPTEIEKRFSYIIAAYLLALGGDEPANQAVALNRIDLANWMNYPNFATDEPKRLNKILKKITPKNATADIIYEDGLFTIWDSFLKQYDFKIEEN